MAFFEGSLRHTNEVKVDLGEGYVVECSASHAIGILNRRKARLEPMQAESNSIKGELNDRLLPSGKSEGSAAELLDIRETVEER